MAKTNLEPGGFYEFDLPGGAIKARNAGRMLVFSDPIVTQLISIAVDHGDLSPIRDLGIMVGEVGAGALGDQTLQSAPEVVAHHVSTAVALFGWGTLVFERWGDALVVKLDNAPTLDDEGLAKAAFLGGLMSAISDATMACVPVGEEAAQFLAVHIDIAEEVWGWAQDGLELGTIVSRMTAAQ